MIDSAVTELTLRCLSPLEEMHTISRAYRGVKGSFVDHHMAYVDQMILPLVKFDPSYKAKEIVTPIIDMILKKFLEAAELLLKKEKESAKLFERLIGSEPYLFKIRAQLCIDLNRLGVLIERYTSHPTSDYNGYKEAVLRLGEES